MKYANGAKVKNLAMNGGTKNLYAIWKATKSVAKYAAAGAQDVNYDLEGIWDEYNSSTGLVDRNTFSPLELIGMDFDVCRPVYSDYLADKGYKNAIGDMKYSDPIPFTMDLSVEDTVLPAGQYRLRYAIKDMLDRTYYTDFFDLTWDGQNAVFADPTAEAEPAD